MKLPNRVIFIVNAATRRLSRTFPRLSELHCRNCGSNIVYAETEDDLDVIRRLIQSSWAHGLNVDNLANTNKPKDRAQAK